MAKEKEKPLTREDVRRLIKEHGGTAKGLDLSGKVFEEGINLSGLDLKEANLMGAHLVKANLSGAKLQRADLLDANLQEADLSFANLEKATLAGANLQKADISGANLQGVKCKGIDLRNAIIISTDLRGAVIAGADMRGALFLSVEFNRDTDFTNVNWGSKCFAPRWIEKTAERTYLDLKNWHNEAGMYNIAGEFSYREMTARRNSFWLGEEDIMWLRERGFLLAGKSRTEYLREHLHPLKPRKLLRAIFPRRPFHWAWSMLLNLLCGYGEKPLRVIISAAVVVVGSALIYFGIGMLTPSTFLDCLYYSAVSFTALGYGSWIKEATGWVKGLGAFEAFVGVFMIALFLVTFTRKMTR